MYYCWYFSLQTHAAEVFTFSGAFHSLMSEDTTVTLSPHSSCFNVSNLKTLKKQVSGIV
jgi:hypothetical protein